MCLLIDFTLSVRLQVNSSLIRKVFGESKGIRRFLTVAGREDWCPYGVQGSTVHIWFSILDTELLKTLGISEMMRARDLWLFLTSPFQPHLSLFIG